MSSYTPVKENKPPRIIIYGSEGIGKSRFGSLAPNPVFLQTEDGLDAIDCAAFNLAETYEEFMGQLLKVCEDDHDHKTVVIDSLDWLEKLIWSKLIKDRPYDEKGRKVSNIVDYGYGKGYVMVMGYWDEYFRAINYLRNKRNIMVIQTAHSKIKKFENPETDAYDRYEIKLHEGVSASLQEHSDIILFANHATTVKVEEKGFGGERKRAVSNGDRILHTQSKPAFMAKSRYNHPAEILFDNDGAYWATIAKEIPFFNKTKTKEGE